MKKNVKILGATASAAVIGGDTDTTAPATNDYKLTISSSTVNANAGTTVSSLLSNTSIANALSLSATHTTGTPSIVGVQNAQVVDGLPTGSTAANALSGDTTLSAGNTYYIHAQITVNNLAKTDAAHSTIDYAIQGNDGGSIKLGSNSQGTIANINVYIPVHVNDTNAIGQPYFYDKTARVNLNDGDYAKGSAEFSDTVKGLLDNANAQVKAYVNNGQGIQDATVTTTPAEVRTQLANQGITVTDPSGAQGGNVSFTAKKFYITLTALNPLNNSKTVSVKVQFNSANTLMYPLIEHKNGVDSSNKVIWNKVQQGDKNYSNPATIQAVAGTDAAKKLAANPADGWQAITSGDGVNPATSGRIDLKTVANNINASQAGFYQVTLSATNPNGYTTKYTYNVILTPNNGQATIHFVPGYGVNVWKVLSDNSVAYAGFRVAAGTSVHVYENKTINGVAYSRIGANQWVQTQYLSDAWKIGKQSNTNKPSTSSEEKASGVATVTYKGRGGVNLLNAEGKYQNQYVKKGSAWKVFAKKTINGEPMYRLGTQSQWIPAKYVSVK
jgi:hypothetical protein